MAQFNAKSNTIHTLDVTVEDVTYTCLVPEPPTDIDDCRARITEAGKLLVTFLVQDDDCQSNFDTCDGEGRLCLNAASRDHIRSDFYSERDLRDHFHLVDNEYRIMDVQSDYVPDVDFEFEVDGVKTTLMKLAVEIKFADCLSLYRNMEHVDHADDEATVRQAMQDENGIFFEETMYSAWNQYKYRWKNIVGPYVVPLTVSFSNSSMYSVKLLEWDGDFIDPPSHWIAETEDERGNTDANACPPGYHLVPIKEATGWGISPDINDCALIKSDDPTKCAILMGNHGDVHRQAIEIYGKPGYQGTFEAAQRYAMGVMKEYLKWCEGDCWGVYSMTYEAKESKHPLKAEHEDATWGMIGHDWAIESMEEQLTE